MLLELILQDERREGGRAEGKAESIISLLEDLAIVPEALQEKVMSETDLVTLKSWLKRAAKAESIEQFINEM